MAHSKPIYRVVVDGNDITPLLMGGSGKISRLESLTLTDNRGMDADQLELVLSDHDGALAIPPKGAVITVAIGWQHSGLVDKGSYTVDESEHSGAPDKLTIRAHSADLRDGLSSKRERSWHRTTVGAMVNEMAARHKLEPVVSEDLVDELIEHIDQTSESDINLLSRIAHDFDAIATIKQKRLLFVHAGEATTVSGQPMPLATFSRRDGDSHRYSAADRGSHSGVKAYYQDTKGAKKAEVMVGKERTDEGAAGDNIKVLRHVYASKSSAERAARSAMRKDGRGKAEFSLSIARGRPELVPEMPAAVQGWKPEIDGTDWLITKVTHLLSNTGYVSQIEFEVGGGKGRD